MPELPSGTVTFLFTDIEGSTKLLNLLQEDYQTLLSEQRAIVRAAIRDNGGREVDTQGDAFFISFPRASAAVRAAVDIQRATIAQTWPDSVQVRLRMGLHTGEPWMAEGGYAGIDVHRAARIAHIAYGGQVLLSETTSALVRSELPDGVNLVELGSYLLKDIEAPEPISQLVIDGMISQFPDLAVPRGKSGNGVFNERHRNHNLPSQRASFIGREKEISTIIGLLKSTRLLVLTGPGGTGKTSLAIQAARRLIDDYQNGVWFVDLAPVSDPDQIPDAIVRAMNINLVGSSPASALLADLIRKRVLLLLDNFEHLLTGASFVSEILSTAPDVTVLATSRERLNIYGEREYPIHPLSLPGSRRQLTTISAMEYEAVRLFVERAQTVRPDFILDERRIPSVVGICERLDGLPLAIELAASQTRMYPAQVLVDRLGESLGALPAGPRDAPARQRTLRSTIEWSYDLLSDEEKTLFTRVSIFQGGGTQEAIEQVCFSGILGEPPILLSSLLEKSLLIRQLESHDEPRFGMLETIREFARNKLDEYGEDDSVSELHAAFFTEIAEKAETEIRGKRHGYWFRRLRIETDNLRLALRWSLQGENPEYGLRIVASLSYFWYYDGHITEGQTWSRLAMDRSTGAPPILQAGVRSAAGWFMAFTNSNQGIRLTEEALEIYRELGEERKAAFIQAYLSSELANREHGFQRGLSLAREALEIFLRLDEEEGVVYALNVLGELSRLGGDYSSAKEYYEECLQIASKTGELIRVPMQYGNLSYIAYYEGDYKEGLALARKALLEFRALGIDYGVISHLENVAGCLTPLGEAEQAATLLGAHEALLSARGSRRQNVDISQIETYIEEARNVLGEGDFQKAWQNGEKLTLDEAVDLALED